MHKDNKIDFTTMIWLAKNNLQNENFKINVLSVEDFINILLIGVIVNFILLVFLTQVGLLS